MFTVSGRFEQIELELSGRVLAENEYQAAITFHQYVKDNVNFHGDVLIIDDVILEEK